MTTPAATKDIMELIDREADLLNRGRSEKSVEGNSFPPPFPPLFPHPLLPLSSSLSPLPLSLSLRHPKIGTALRQRISNLFLKFIETPAFNPEAASLKANKSKKVST